MNLPKSLGAHSGWSEVGNVRELVRTDPALGVAGSDGQNRASVRAKLGLGGHGLARNRVRYSQSELLGGFGLEITAGLEGGDTGDGPAAGGGARPRPLYNGALRAFHLCAAG